VDVTGGSLVKSRNPGTAEASRGEIMKKSTLSAWFLLLSLAAITSSLSATEVTVFGPKQYMRTSAARDLFSDTFAAEPGQGKLIVRNGSSGGGQRVDCSVSSAQVILNGEEIFGPSDFNQQVYYLEAAVNLAASNSMSIKLGSSPDSYLTIEVTKTAPPAIVITNPISGSTLSSTAPLVTITFTSDGAGIDPTSLRVEADGLDQSADFAKTDSKAQWQVAAPFSPGAHVVSASISDYAGNVGTAVSHFTVASSLEPIRYLFSVTNNDWIFASPGDGTYRQYLSGEALGLFDAADLVSLSKVLPEGDVFFTLAGQGGIFQSPGDGTRSLSFDNARLGLLETDRILGLHLGLDGSILFAAQGQPHIWASSGRLTRGPYLEQLSGLGILDSLQLQCLHIGYDGTIYFCFSGGEGVFVSPGDGTHRELLSPADLGVPGSAIDAFSLLPDMEPPALTVTDPPNGATIATRTPAITIAFSDLESGVDLGSFAVEVNGKDWTGQFSVISSEASYQAADALPFGENVITATIKDSVGNTALAVSNFTVAVPAPTVSISANPESILYGETATLSWSSTNATSVTLEPGVGFVAPTGSVEVNLERTTTFTMTAVGAGGTASARTVVTVRANVVPPPVGSFGEQYVDLIPPDSTVGSYDPKRFSLITGLVQDLTKAPLTDVSVSILEYPKYGTALTDSEGRFSIPMDGGATYTLVYRKTGLIPAQRKVSVPWNDTAVAPTVQLVAEDPVSTTLTFNGDPATFVTHESTLVTDGLGRRSCTMVFTGDNRAYEVDARGTVIRELATITTRATEFPTPESMPAILPPTSAFTYCAELSVDGVERVTFQKPVAMWVDNFLGFPVGMIVPVGSYDRDRGVWVAEENGVVVRLLDTNGDGIVDALDSNSDGQPNDLNGDGSFGDEVRGLSDTQRYLPGSTFWRVTLTHFTPIDLNWPPGFPPDAIPPNPPGVPQVDQPKLDRPDCVETTPRSSFVEDRNRTFHEEVPIPGTDVTLHYASQRVQGYRYTITVPASGEVVPASLKRILVKAIIGGRSLVQVLDPAPNLEAALDWDGLDHLGSVVANPAPAQIEIDFVYNGVYLGPKVAPRSFAQPGVSATAVQSRDDVTLSRHYAIPINRGGLEGDIAQGWTLSVRHHLNPMDPSTLYRGDGRTATNSASVITTVAGTGTFGYSGDGGPAVNAQLRYPSGVAVDAAGNLYIADQTIQRIRKVDANGIITTVAGTGTYGFGGDGGLAINAKLSFPYGVTVDAVGNVYILDSNNYRIRKVDTNGIITTVAGNGSRGYSGDGGPAVNAQIWDPRFATVDRGGNLYLTDYGNNRIRKVDANGIITTVAGTGTPGFNGDGGPAVNAQICKPTGVVVDGAGNLYFADFDNVRIRKVDSRGIITTVAGGTGNVYGGYSGDGGPAVNAELNDPHGVAVDSAGNLYVADYANARIRKVDTSGIITTVAGTGTWAYGGDGTPAVNAHLNGPLGVAVDAAGYLYIADSRNSRIRKVSAPTVFFSSMARGDIAFAEENGLGHIFTSSGRHRQTIDLDTRRVIREFSYDGNGYLVSITDRLGNETVIERTPEGVPTAIISPDGIRTDLTVDANNNLTRITYPDSSFYRFAYTADGLMTAKIEPAQNRFDHTFDALGRLTDAVDEEGGHWHYLKTALTSGDLRTVVSSAEGNITSYLDHTDSTGAYTSSITDPSGGQTLYSESGDGLTVSKSLPCGMDLNFEYDVDSEYKVKYVKEMRERTQLFLERVTLRSKTYQDTDSDQIPDRITETVTMNGKTRTLVNDTLKATRTLTSPAGRAVTRAYNPENLLTTTLSVPGLLDTTYGYDVRSRLASITTGSRETTFAFDARGNLAAITDPQSQITGYSYDPVGRLTGIARPDGSSIGFTYDGNGNMTVLTNPATVSHAFGYNKVNLNSSYTTPLSGSYSYGYDKDRRLKQINFPSGEQITNVYANGRLEQIQTPDGNVNLAYVCGTKVASITKGTEGIAYGYDGSLITSERLSGTLNGTLTYGYNNDFNVTSLTYAGGTSTLAYDNDGLLTSSGSFTISRNAGNGLPEAVTGGALALSRAFNGYGEVDGQSVTVGGQSAASWNLVRDNAGRITGKTETVGGSSSTYSYTYDPIGRLRTVTKDGNLVEEYRYDAVGTRVYEMNRLRGIAGRSMSYSVEDHLLSAGSATYQYDVDGYLAAKTQGGSVTTYTYSSRGELLRVAPPDGIVIEYVHDPLGRRIAKKVNGTITEKYLWQGLTKLLALYDGSGALLMRFQYADGRMPVAMTKGGTTYYLAYDQVGSLKVVADASSNVVKGLDYDSFGNIIADTNASFSMPFGFAGGLHDRDTGLVRFGFRDYDPDIGRWTAKDSILFLGGNVDLYGYVLNDPGNLIDPLGLWTFQIGSSFTGGGLLGSTKGGGLIIGKDPNTGEWQFGWYAVGGAGPLGGAGASITADITWSSNPCIQDVGGWTSTGGGSLTPLPPFTFGAEMNIPLTGDASPSYTGSFGLSIGTPYEGHGFVTYTHVGRLF
jgi:RHS repeat-associated protein